ncbi:MAG: hypothetical protein FGF51_08160 [Candidatus Brockarchaeota archaeon]|nr:hypothetical protein [Candidatus Brockarchaeota archaeon]
MFTLLLTIFFALMSVVTGMYTDKINTFSFFVLPMIYIVVVMELLGRLNPRLRLTAQEYVFIFSVLTFIAGYLTYLVTHAPANEPVHYFNYGALSDYVAFSIDDLKEYWSRAVPSVVIAPEPIRFEIATLIMNGRAPGQAVPWSYITSALIYWNLIYIFYAFISIFVTFAFGKVWIEDERLVLGRNRRRKNIVTASISIHIIEEKPRYPL